MKTILKMMQKLESELALMSVIFSEFGRLLVTLFFSCYSFETFEEM